MAFSNSPRLVKGGIVLVDPDTGAVRRVIALQYNPEKLSRSFKVQRMPLLIARVGMKLLRRPNDALASVFGAGVLQDQAEVTWDDGPLVQRGITPRSATDWITQQVAGAE